MARKKKKKTSIKSKARDPIFPVLSDEIFTDREDLLSLLKENALDAKGGGHISTVLIGRRVGKTQVLKRVYDQLFWEQDEVVLIYISFEELRRTTEDFAPTYLQTFPAQYVGFKLKSPHAARHTARGMSAAKSLIKTKGNKGIQDVLGEYESAIKEGCVDDQLLLAITSPSLTSDTNHEPIFVILDEFQYVIDIRDKGGTDPNPLDKYQAAVESRYCPHLVTGLPATLLTKDIIGRGPLDARFCAEYIRGLEDYYVVELAEKLGKHYDLRTSPDMANELARRTSGNPFYIDCIFDGARLQRKSLTTLMTLMRSSLMN